MRVGQHPRPLTLRTSRAEWRARLSTSPHQSVPRRLRSRSFETLLTWSPSSRPSIPRNVEVGRNRAAWLPLVIGMMITVPKWAFMVSGLTIAQGRVFRISLPSVGSSRVSQTSPCFGRARFKPRPHPPSATLLKSRRHLRSDRQLPASRAPLPSARARRYASRPPPIPRAPCA